MMNSLLIRHFFSTVKKYKPLRPLLADQNRIYSRPLPYMPSRKYEYAPAFVLWIHNCLTQWSIVNSIVWLGVLSCGAYFEVTRMVNDSSIVYGVVCDRDFKEIVFELQPSLFNRNYAKKDDDILRSMCKIRVDQIVKVIDRKNKEIAEFEEGVDKELRIFVKMDDGNIEVFVLDLSKNLDKSYVDYLLALATKKEVEAN